MWGGAQPRRALEVELGNAFRDGMSFFMGGVRERPLESQHAEMGTANQKTLTPSDPIARGLM